MNYTYHKNSDIIGDTGVGKSTILNRFLYNTGKALLVKYNGEIIKLTLRENDQIDSKREVLFVVYDITNKKSFEFALTMLYFYSVKKIPIVLVGNKSDLEKERAVDIEDVRKASDDYKVPFIDISAKYNDNMPNVLKIMCNMISYDMDRLLDTRSVSEFNMRKMKDTSQQISYTVCYDKDEISVAASSSNSAETKSNESGSNDVAYNSSNGISDDDEESDNEQSSWCNFL